MTLEEFKEAHEKRMARIAEISALIDEFATPLREERQALINQDLKEALEVER